MHVSASKINPANNRTDLKLRVPLAILQGNDSLYMYHEEHVEQM